MLCGFRTNILFMDLFLEGECPEIKLKKKCLWKRILIGMLNPYE